MGWKRHAGLIVSVSVLKPKVISKFKAGLEMFCAIKQLENWQDAKSDSFLLIYVK